MPLRNDVDVLNITQPGLISELHDAYFESGADIATTNTFNATPVTQGDFGLSEHCYELNLAGARLARASADAWSRRTPDRPRWVAGSIGPTNKTSSVAIEVSNPELRGIDFDPLKECYREAARGLVDGGVDILLVETIFDTLNAKAAIVAIEELAEERQLELPLILSWTATDRSGRNLSGQTVGAFWNAIAHARPAGGRHQLLVRRRRPQAERRRALPRGDRPGRRLPERRAAERPRSLRGDPRGDSSPDR